jgi:peroxiredoxin Q/BCP
MAALATALILAASGSLSAQATPRQPSGPDVGQPAPDFALTGATRYGVLRDPVKLADFKGQTVVIAFFFKARTRG